MRVLITGAGGFIGGILIDRLLRRCDTELIIALDKNDIAKQFAGNSKIVTIQANTCHTSWQKTAADLSSTIVIHCAWQIQEVYWQPKLQYEWNIEGSQNVFLFAQETSSVKTLIHFSSVAAYGAYPINSLDHFLIEDAPLKEDTYRYGFQKKLVERNLKALAVKHEDIKKSIVVLRVSSLSGPQFKKKKRFNLQAILKKYLPIIPASPLWNRQFLHEEDLLSMVERIIDKPPRDYQTFNLAPDDHTNIYQLSGILKKRLLFIRPSIVRLLFFLARHSSFGKIPTARESWRFYCYPILVSNKKFKKEYAYQCMYSSCDALQDVKTTLS